MPRKAMSKTEWSQLLASNQHAFETFTGRVMVSVSGGSASAVVWKRCLDAYGPQRVVPVFADTNSEHADTYRFLVDCERVLGQELTRLNDGRNIWDVFHQTGMLRIARVNACKASIELKQKPLDRFKKNSNLDATAIGLEFLEGERMRDHIAKRSGETLLFPLSCRPYLSECEIHDEVRTWGIEPPKVYEEGQPHNNCRKYGCILAGVAQWANDVKNNPEGFNYSADREAEFYEKTGFSVCRDQSGGEVKSYPLRQLAEDVKSGKKFRDDWRSQCSCMEPALFTADDCM